MNAIDRAIAAVSPVWGAKRAAARRALRLIEEPSKRYSGNAADWDRNTGNPDAARPARFVDRRRVLDLLARDPFAKKALNVLVNNTVGWGITGAPKNATKAFAKLWADWIKVADWYGRLDLYGLQELWARTMFREGEVFIVFQTISLQEAAGTVPLRLQTLDAGMLASTVATFNGNPVLDGIELDRATGRVIAYHFYVGRPGQIWTSYQTVRVLAEDCIHLFVQEHVGQRRGISAFESVIKRLGDIDESVEAEIVRKNIEACFAAFITQGVDDDGNAVFGQITGDHDLATGAPGEALAPGMISRLAPGESVKFGDPKASGGLNDIVKLALMSAAAGVGITYEHFGDLSNVNYSSYKAGHIEFERSIGRIQFNTIIPVCLNRVSSRFQASAFLAGLMPNRTYEMSWATPPFGSVDKVKDITGDVLAMEAGLESRPNLVMARGYNPDDLRAEIAADRDANKAVGLEFVGDVVPAPTAKPSKIA